jgi:gluconate 5-dehydrogenase
MGVLEQFRLDGRVAVITGGSKGLGKAMAAGLVEAGAAVVLCSRHGQEAEAAAAEVAAAAGGTAIGIEADVTQPESVDHLVQAALARFGQIDVWVNSAGINIRHPIEDFPVEDFQRVLDVNLRGTWLCCRAVAPVLKRQQRGSVINLASVLGTIGLRERSAYCASKAGVIGLTRTLALEWAASAVRCNALCPGPFLTEINAALLADPAKARAVVGQTAFQRWAELREIQGPALFLASDASSYMTGAVLVLDGGWSAA